MRSSRHFLSFIIVQNGSPDHLRPQIRFFRILYRIPKMILWDPMGSQGSPSMGISWLPPQSNPWHGKPWAAKVPRTLHRMPLLHIYSPCSFIYIFHLVNSPLGSVSGEACKHAGSVRKRRTGNDLRSKSLLGRAPQPLGARNHCSAMPRSH